jgi:hypothetical protein
MSKYIQILMKLRHPLLDGESNTILIKISLLWMSLANNKIQIHFQSHHRPLVLCSEVVHERSCRAHKATTFDWAEARRVRARLLVFCLLVVGDHTSATLCVI